MFRIRQTIQQHSKQIFHSSGRLTTTTTPFSVQSQLIRNFSLFKVGQSSGGSRMDQNLAQAAAMSHQRSQAEVLESIAKYQNNIVHKTKHGYGLSMQIAESVEENKFQRKQMYEIFVNKMDALYKSELRFRSKQKKKMQLQKNAILYSITPLKDILKTYNEMTTRGFSSELVAETLKNVKDALRARGYRARVMGDYSHSELEQSWRMQKLIDDIIFGLKPDQFYSPVHLAETSNLLGNIGYKNTDLLPHFFTKIKALLDERLLGKKEYQTLEFNHAVYGGPKNFIPRHYVFRGFENSDDFNSYLQILLDWENQRPTLPIKSQKQLDNEALELQQAMKDLVDAAIQVKELQKDFQSTIENVRTQYFMMLEATDKHSFLQENEYIKYDLLELQEMLVKGGFIEPEEANVHLAKEPFNDKMERAAQVFYDYVLNYAPELVSPQYNSFYEAAVKTISENTEKQVIPKNLIQENHNLLNLSTLSQTLVGLESQVLSYRRDVARKDYLNKFYEDYTMPLEQKPRAQQLERVNYEAVRMDRSYLRAWKIFKQESGQLLPYLRDLVQEDRNLIDGQLNAIHALAACRFDEPELRKEIINNCLNLFKQEKIPVSKHAVQGGLMGLALSSSIDEKGEQLAKKLAAKVDASNYTFSDQLDVLWALCALKQYDSKGVATIVRNFNKLNFERLDHDLRYEEFVKMIDVINALQLEASHNKNIQITNPTILAGLTGKDFYLQGRFEESQATFDPFKNRVIEALGKGLSQASISHEAIIQNELVHTFEMDSELLNPEKYPYKPDIVMGYKNLKLGVFVLPDAQVMRDTNKAEGATRFRMRLLEKAGENKIKAVQISVPQVVQYDIEAFKIGINNQFNLANELEAQIQGLDKQFTPNFDSLSGFGSQLAQNVVQFSETLGRDRDVKKMDSFIKKLFQIFQIKQQAGLRYEYEQIKTDYDELRFQLMQLDLLYDSLSKECQEFINQYIPSNYRQFQEMLLDINKTLWQDDRLAQQNDVTPALDSSWLGTRLEVELPSKQLTDQGIKKSIVPEMINQRFMWVNDYFHYQDWKEKQQQVFDNFNLLMIPHNKNDHKFFFDQNNFRRRIPQGVFPFPNHKRQLLKPHAQSFALEIARGGQGNDELVLFEKEPYKMMVLNELKKAEQLKAIDQETSMITNLQNVKQSLKANYTDREILDTILLNLDFTDDLIEEHLGLKQNEATKNILNLDRDPSQYRKFVESTYYSKDREDPYSHFFLKEGAMKEAMMQEIQEEAVQENWNRSFGDPKAAEQNKQNLEKLWDKVDNFLLENELKNEDLLNLSSALKQRVKINYDMKSLVKSEFVYDIEPELVDQELTDQQYINIARRRAESKLIKSKIIYKMNLDEDLSSNEKKYLNKWVKDIQNNKDRNLFNLRDSLLPSEPTKLTFNDVDGKSFYTLNSISKVQIDRDAHGSYSLNELVLELGHFLDEEVINKIETEFYSDRMRNDWGMTKDFRAVETRNKEIGLVLNELEELAFRSSGMFTDQDVQALKKMISVKRNKDVVDQSFYENDMKSFQQYVEAINTYDDRINKLERWITRKEDEINQRFAIAPAAYRKTDQELHAEFDKPYKKAREQLVAQLLAADEHGNPINKQYKDLTSKELNTISENLCVRLYLFNYEYPSFLPHMVKAIIEHPNLMKSDQHLVETYCKMFELDWKCDHNIENRTNLMFQNPIYQDGTNIKSYGEITNEKVEDRMRQACAPYVEETAAKLLNLAQ